MGLPQLSKNIPIVFSIHGIHPTTPRISSEQLLRDLLPALLLQDAAHGSFRDVLHLEPSNPARKKGDPIGNTSNNGFKQPKIGLYTMKNGFEI